MDLWTKACVAQTGSQNIYRAGESYYMWEVSRVEHRDGAITGTILRFTDNPLGKDSCGAVRVGAFRIEPNGIAAKAPAFLRNAK